MFISWIHARLLPWLVLAYAKQNAYIQTNKPAKTDRQTMSEHIFSSHQVDDFSPVQQRAIRGGGPADGRTQYSDRSGHAHA